MDYTKDFYNSLKESMLRNGFGGTIDPYLDRVDVEVIDKQTKTYALKVYPFEGALPGLEIMYLVDFARANRCEINLYTNWDNEPYFQIQKIV